MDNTILLAMMASGGLFMAMIPFGIFMGLATMLEVGVKDTRVLLVLALTVLAVSYLLSFGSFAIIQQSNCGKVKNMKQVASNAGLALAIQAITLTIIYFIPWFRHVVTDLLPPDLDPPILAAVGYGYWTMWASLYGTAIGGTLSGVCQ